MPLFFDRVKETTVTTGTSNITLAGAVSGFRAFNDVLSSTNTVYYTIEGGANWEVGIGTFTSPATLARTTVLASSNANVAVDFSAGTKNVFCTIAAQYMGLVALSADLATVATTGDYDDLINKPTIPAVGGSDTQLQYNNSGAFGGTAQAAWDDAADNLLLGTPTLVSTAKLNIKVTTGNAYNLFLEGTGGVVIPTIGFKHISDATGVALAGNDSGFTMSNIGEGATLFMKPGYPDSYWKTHGSSSAKFHMQSHDGSAYLDSVVITSGLTAVGHDTPLAKLDVHGTTAGTAVMNIRGASSQSADMLCVRDSGGNQLCAVESSGWVMLGSGTASVPLHILVNDTGTNTKFCIEQSGSGDAAMKFLLTSTRAWVLGIDNSASDAFRISPADDGFGSALFTISTAGAITLPGTITATGTTGNRTINKATGRVNIAAAGTAVTVTNSLVTANSIVLAVPATNDATARVTSVVPAAGSFVINTVACTAETAFNFLVINP